MWPAAKSSVRAPGPLGKQGQRVVAPSTPPAGPTAAQGTHRASHAIRISVSEGGFEFFSTELAGLTFYLWE